LPPDLTTILKTSEYIYSIQPDLNGTNFSVSWCDNKFIRHYSSIAVRLSAQATETKFIFELKQKVENDGNI